VPGTLHVKGKGMPCRKRRQGDHKWEGFSIDDGVSGMSPRKNRVRHPGALYVAKLEALLDLVGV
jgi:hypothetical protein